MTINTISNKSDIVTLAADDRLAVDDTSASATTKYCTPLEIATYVLTKVISTANLFTKQQSISSSALTSTSNAVAWDVSSAQIATHTLTENTTISAPSNQVSGTYYTLRVTQHASSAKTLAFNSVFKFPQGQIPVMTTTLSAIDIFVFLSNGTNMECIGISQNIS